MEMNTFHKLHIYNIIDISLLLFLSLWVRGCVMGVESGTVMFANVSEFMWFALQIWNENNILNAIAIAFKVQILWHSFDFESIHSKHFPITFI